jgi:hypothetical protein
VKVVLKSKIEENELAQLIKNSKGNIYYGMHFYPGVAEYQEPGKDAFRIFINEDTIRQMAPTFAGRPIFVDHVDEVGVNVDDVKNECDGWVIESFFNEADGKHWAKFIVVSERAEQAIRRGYRLSNAYLPRGSYGPGGVWNGVTYSKQVLGGEYEHLAIVKNPRYAESVIYTPDQFKTYCEEQKQELKRLANAKENEPMKIQFFKKKVEKVENASDLIGLHVTLPKSGKEVTVEQIINEMDAMASLNGFANDDMKVKVGENEMTVKDLVANYGKLCSELEGLKKAKGDEEGTELENEEGDEDEADIDAEEADEGVDNEDEDAADEDKDKGKKSNSQDAPAPAPAPKAKKSKENFDKLKNARNQNQEQDVVVDLSMDRIERGRQRYGSKRV